MNQRKTASLRDAPAVVIEIGNTNTDVATWHKDQIKTPLSVPTNGEAAFDKALAAHISAMPKRHVPAVIVASVVPDALARVVVRVQSELDRRALVVGDTIPLPIDVGVTDASAVGVDRVCAAAAAYDKLQSACVVIDFGSAVTVDLVNDDGVLAGGAILPGLRMQLRVLHENTAVLPVVEPEMPESPIGRNTIEAMQTGVCRGVAGAARALVEAYATYLNRWPHVVATGGDLELLSPLCDYLDAQVQHLALRGVGVAYMRHIEILDA